MLAHDRLVATTPMTPIARRSLLLAALIAMFATGMTYFLITFKVEHQLRDLQHTRFALAVNEIERIVEQSLSVGMDFTELGTLPAALMRKKQSDNAIVSILVADANAKILYAAVDDGRPNSGNLLPQAWQNAIDQVQSRRDFSAQSAWRIPADDNQVSVAGKTVVNSFGVVQGVIAIAYRDDIGSQMLAQLKGALCPTLVVVLAAATFCIFLCLLLIALHVSRVTTDAAIAFRDGTALPKNTWHRALHAADTALQRATVALQNGTAVEPQQSVAPSGAGSPPFAILMLAGIAFILLIVTLSMATIALSALGHAKHAIDYEATRSAQGVGRSLATHFDRAATLGLPLEKIPDINSYLSDMRAHNAAIGRIAVVVSSQPVFASPMTNAVPPDARTERVAFRLSSGANAQIEVSTDPARTAKIFREMIYDFVVILVVTVFITIELIYFLAGATLVSPMRTLHTSILQLGSGRLSTSIPSNFPGALRDLALALRRRQDVVLAQYRAAHRQLRSMLATRDPAILPEDMRNSVRQFFQLKQQFGLRQHSERTSLIDSADMLGRMRAPFFLLLLAEDLSRSFLPTFAARMSVTGIAISPDLAVGLPIFIFMLIVAISQPALGGWCDRVGRRQAFIVGAVAAVIAHLLTAQATTLWGLLTWRALAGIAWAIVFVAAQGIVLDHTDNNGTSRIKGLAGFVAVIMVSLACGPAVGGVLADGLGHRVTFMIAAALALLALLIGWHSLPTRQKINYLKNYDNYSDGEKDKDKDKDKHQEKFPPRKMLTADHVHMMSQRHPLLNRRFLGLLLLAALPAKLILVAYCYYLIPLFMSSTGHSAAESGRMIMLYSLMMVMFVPIAANASRRFQQIDQRIAQPWMIGCGIALSGLSGLAMLLPNTAAAAALLVTLLGFAQALSISPQAALIPVLAPDEIARYGEATVYGYYRLVERLGSALGSLVAAWLLLVVGYRDAFMWIGIATCIAGVVFTFLYATLPRSTQRAGNAK